MNILCRPVVVVVRTLLCSLPLWHWSSDHVNARALLTLTSPKTAALFCSHSILSIFDSLVQTNSQATRAFTVPDDPQYFPFTFTFFLQHNLCCPLPGKVSISTLSSRLVYIFLSNLHPFLWFLLPSHQLRLGFGVTSWRVLATRELKASRLGTALLFLSPQPRNKDEYFSQAEGSFSASV